MSESSIDRVGTTIVQSAGPARRLGVVGVIDSGAKRAFDIGVAGVLLLLLSPVILGCAIAIKVESRGPVFYRARRVGRYGRELRVLKFRKMYNGASGHALTGDVDPRFTRIGRWLARTKLDEVPQLWNVLRGKMSLVGPRPEDEGFVALHAPEYDEILAVRPGITGLCQLAFAKEAEILDPEDRMGHYVDQILPQKVKLDMYYAQTRTFGGDFRILLWTVLPVFLRSDVAVNRLNGQLTVRRREADAVGSSSPPA
ncbi:MAG TPA: sugar transferase [Gaiella sp.]|jgi:lipopolysaccharide/colanic/teichoic acid biosynthesis glycosyltransferase